MKLKFVHHVLGATLATLLFVSTPSWSYTLSSTHAHRVPTSCGSNTTSKWFVEISESSFANIRNQVDLSEPFFTTIERIQVGFGNLRSSSSEMNSLGFYWEDSENSMCSLYGVTLNVETSCRELVLAEAYATIEPSSGSCKNNGRHLRDLVITSKSTTQISSGRLWGAIVNPQHSLTVYRPMAVSVDHVSIMIGLVPIASQLVLNPDQIPYGEWEKSLADPAFEIEWPSFADEWRGIEATASVSPIPIDKWQGWVSAIPSEIVPPLQLAKWSRISPYADTPPVTISEWERWAAIENDRINLIQAQEWTEVVPDWSFDHSESDSMAEWSRVVWASELSQKLYHTPAFGMLIESVCPPEFVDGKTPCMLPQFDDSRIPGLKSSTGKILRIPIVESGKWNCSLPGPKCEIE